MASKLGSDTIFVGARFIAPALHSDGEKSRQRRKSLRLRHFDYASSGCYFVTVCTRERRRIFGIANEAMLLSKLGRMIEASWQGMPAHFTCIEIDEWVVMPNHLHGIVSIKSQEPGVMNRAPTLGEFVRNCKARTTRAWAATAGKSAESLWQRGYFEHIIRNEADLARVREYIVNNPPQWALDEENSSFEASLDELERP